MDNISEEETEKKYNLKYPKKVKKSKRSSRSKKDFDNNTNTTENSSNITNHIKPKSKFSHFSLNSKINILSQYSGFPSKHNIKKKSFDSLNFKKLSKNNTQDAKLTPHFLPLRKIESVPDEKCYTPDKAEKKHKKHKQHHHKKNNDALHKLIKSDYKEILKNYVEKPIKINYVSQKFKIANDFNEINSKIFLYEKDKYLKKENLTDEIEEDEKSKDMIEFTLNPKKNIIKC